MLSSRTCQDHGDHNIAVVFTYPRAHAGHPVTARTDHNYCDHNDGEATTAMVMTTTTQRNDCDRSVDDNDSDRQGDELRRPSDNNDCDGASGGKGEGNGAATATMKGWCGQWRQRRRSTPVYISPFLSDLFFFFISFVSCVVPRHALAMLQTVFLTRSPKPIVMRAPCPPPPAPPHPASPSEKCRSRCVRDEFPQPWFPPEPCVPQRRR